MRINVSERFLHPVDLARLQRGGLLLPEEILLIRQKAPRTVCPLCVCVFHGAFRESGDCSVDAWLLCGDLFKDSNLDVTGIEDSPSCCIT